LAALHTALNIVIISAIQLGRNICLAGEHVKARAKYGTKESAMKTRITELLGIRHPIIQGAMAWISFPPLVAAVSNAGGLGILGSAFMSPDVLRENIRMIKQLSDKPFGVNFVPESPQIDDLLAVIVEEKVRVVNYGIGDPKKIIEVAKAHNIIAMPTVGAVRHAVKAERGGAGAVILQGTEAGGHSSYVTTMVLVPLVAERVKIPIVAAGGFGDARGLVAALALGAEGISMGTRFIVTKESPAHPNVKQKIIESSEEDTVVTTHITGLRARVIYNKLAEAFLAGDKEKDRSKLLSIPGKLKRAFVDGDIEGGSIAAGQVCGMIDDIPSCQELIERIVHGAEEIVERIATRVLS
jgi:enoyl-[acyl-carrier protein] reductase II